MSDDELKILRIVLELQRDLLKLHLAVLQKKNPPTGGPAEQKFPEIAKHQAPWTKNRKKILKFIRRASIVRAKDVVDEFNILSARTVKRNLRELADEGFIARRSEGPNVYYAAVDRKNA